MTQQWGRASTIKLGSPGDRLPGNYIRGGSWGLTGMIGTFRLRASEGGAILWKHHGGRDKDLRSWSLIRQRNGYGYPSHSSLAQPTSFANGRYEVFIVAQEIKQLVKPRYLRYFSYFRRVPAFFRPGLAV